VELSLNSKLLSIPQDQGKPSGSKRRNPGLNIEVTMYSCLLPDFHLIGALCRIFTGVPIAELSLNSELISIAEFLLKSSIVGLSLKSELF